MIFKKIAAALALSVMFCVQIKAQDLDELANKYGRVLLETDYPLSEGYTYGEDNTLHHPDHDFTLGHISVNVNKASKGDFNKDGVEDYWGSIFDEGMGGGGNMFGYELGIFQIENNDTLKFIPFFEGSKFSDIVYTLQGFKKGNPLIGVGVNFQGSYGNNIQVDEIVEIAFQNNTIIPVSYNSNCNMSKMNDKTIFKSTVSGVVRTQTMSDFLDEQQEEIYTNGSRTFSAVLCGCNSFFIEFLVKDSNKNNKNHFVGNAFDFLIEHTRFASIIKKLKMTYQEEGPNGSDYIKNENGWFYTINDSETNDGLELALRYYHEN